MALERLSPQNTALVDTLKARLGIFRTEFVSRFGTELEFSFLKAGKTISTTPGASTVPNTTLAEIQVENEKEFGVLHVLFDDKSGKIIQIFPLDSKFDIPNRTVFWLFGLFPLGILIFNIIVISKINRSTLRRKWLKYVAIVFLNAPTITYGAVAGIGIKVLNFQLLGGLGFSYTGYLNSVWSFGIPLAGLYWIWKLRRPTWDDEYDRLIQEQAERENREDVFV